MYEFIYVETGTNNAEKGYNPDNRFVYDQTTSMFIDNPSLCGSNPLGNGIYTLTELRPNDGDNTGTVIQPAKRISRFLKMIRL